MRSGGTSYSEASVLTDRVFRTLPWVTLLVGVFASWLIWRALLGRDDEVASSHFQLDAQERGVAIEDELTDALAALEQLVSLFIVEPNVGREEFRVYAARMRESNSSLAALGWEPLVRAEEREAHEAEGRSQGITGYQITERLAQGTMVRAADRPEYVVVYFIEPYEGNESALGFDVSSEEKRLRALTRARDTGELSTTARIRLVQEERDEHAFLAFSPLYHSAKLPETVDARRQELRGFLVAAFRISDIVERALGRFDPVGIHVTLLDEDGDVGDQELYSSNDDLRGESEVVRHARIRNGQRSWRLTFRPSDRYLASHHSLTPLVAFLIGLVATMILVTYLVLQQRRAEQIQRLVRAREDARAELRRSEERLRLTLAAITDGWWDWDLGTNEIDFSRSWLDAMGIDSEGVGAADALLKRVHPDDASRESAARAAHLDGLVPLYDCEVRLRREGGDYRWTRRRGRVVERGHDGLPRRMVGVDTDVTRERDAEALRRRHEDRARHAQKLESLGVLTGGIAHDFNNLLMGILGNAELALHKLPPDSPVLTPLTQIHSVSTRAADLVRQMLAYAGRNPGADEPVELPAILREMRGLLSASISKKATLQFDSASDVPSVRGDASQLRQVFMNLILNASEAMGGESGRILVRCRTVRVERERLQEMFGAPDLAPGEYVSVEVRDDGAGMDEETRTKIFDPFFTTKFLGRGLGLAATLGIVSSHGGAIRVESAPGDGTVFQVLFPPTREGVVKGSSAGHSATRVRRDGGTVLVADDEEAIRSVTANMLSGLGFEVLGAKDGAEAVELFRAHADRLAFVLLDYLMPRMDGKEAFHEMQRIRPGVPVVIASGYNHEMSVKDLGGAIGFLQKPYSLADLRRVVDVALGPQGSSEEAGTAPAS